MNVRNERSEVRILLDDKLDFKSDPKLRMLSQITLISIDLTWTKDEGIG